jgi:hypothetical protein
MTSTSIPRHRASRPRGLALGAAASAAALVAMPSVAGAATSCNYDVAHKTARIQLGAPFGQPTTIKRSLLAGAIQFHDGDGPLQTCFIPNTTEFASVSNIDKLSVRGSPGFEHVVLDEINGTFAPGATPEATGRSAVLIAMTTGTGGDVLDVQGTGFADAISISGSTIGGTVDLDNDGDTDIGMSAPARIAVHGGFGDDRLAATSVLGARASLPITLDGGQGSDTMLGGDAGDLMLGGDGDDIVNSVGGGADVITGDAGSDTAFVDFSDTVSTVESTTKIGKLGGSAKPIRGDARHTVSLPLTWTHPKSWKQLRRIDVLLYDGAKRAGSVKLTPAGAASAAGAVSLDRHATTVGHHGKTVTAKLGLRLATSLKGQTLSVDIAATDRKGHRQLQPAARSIRVHP